MKKLLSSSTWAALVLNVAPTFGALVSWSTSPAVSTSEVNNTGVTKFAYAFSSNPRVLDAVLNGVHFIHMNTSGTMANANSLTPGFERFGADSFAEADNEFYFGPNTEFNQILHGITWGGNTQFQLNDLTPGTPYIVQLFSSDDRAGTVNRVLDLDSSWSTSNGSRQLEDIDYTSGGPWADPAGRSKVFTGTFTADGSSQQILAALDNGLGQIDLNAVQVRSVPESAWGPRLLGLAVLLALLWRASIGGAAGKSGCVSVGGISCKKLWMRSFRW